MVIEEILTRWGEVVNPLVKMGFSVLSWTIEAMEKVLEKRTKQNICLMMPNCGTIGSMKSIIKMRSSMVGPSEQVLLRG